MNKNYKYFALLLCLSSSIFESTFFAQCGATGGIIINEIDYNPSPGSDNEFEFVEFLNTSDADIDVSGWTFTDGEGTYTFPDPTIIVAGGFYVIEAGTIGDVANSNDVFSAGIALSNGGETITLSDGPFVIDEVTYNDTNGWDDGNCGTAGDSDGGGQSLQVEDPCADNSLEDNWTACDPTPGTTNSLALPVELVYLNVRNDQNKTILNWQTASEINNDRFEIERSSDANKYEMIGAVRGEGNSQRAIDYTFTDENPNSGINYYRLKQVDIDGTVAYSDVVSVKIDRKSEVQVTPTSTFDFVTVSTGVQSSIVVRSFNGQVMNMQSDLEGNFNIDMANYPQGVYFLTIDINGVLLTNKVVRL